MDFNNWTSTTWKWRKWKRSP